MEALIIDIMNKFGYLGVMFLIAIENIFPPIPSEVILTFGGFMTTKTTMTTLWVIFFATIGSVLGAIVLYSIGTILNRERLKKILDGKIGRILHFKSEDVDKAYGWFDKRGHGTVFFCRCIPIVRSLISIPAGMAGMNFWKFLALTTLGSTLWNAILVVLGAKAGESWHNIVNIFDEYSNIVLIVLIIVFIVAATLFYKNKLTKEKKIKANEEK